MLKFRKARFGIPYDYVWFAESPRPRDAIGPCVYMQCRRVAPMAGYIQRPFSTKIIDLRQPEEAILKGMNDTTSRKIRKAVREGITVQKVVSVDAFIDFFNAFAQSKSREKLTAGEIDGWGTHTFAFAALRGNEVLVMQSYVADQERGRARLLHSASHFRNLADSAERGEVSRANCYLHFAVMKHWKEAGLSEFDLGGYASGSADPELANIARFKDGFGGVEVREMSFISYPMAVLQKAAGWRRRVLAQRNLGASA